MLQLSNGSPAAHNESDEDQEYLLIERRALLQSVHADNTMIAELRAVCDSLIQPELQLNDLLIALQSYATILSKNTDERRKAFMHIVRHTERRYHVLSPRNIKVKKWLKEIDNEQATDGI